jgi:lambda repressor-like predicted transcriptional regulator
VPYRRDIAQRSAVTARLAEVGLTLGDAAERFGVSYQHMANVARCRTHPSDKVIAGFAEVTGEPLSSYVPEWVLSRPYDPTMGAGPGR